MVIGAAAALRTGSDRYPAEDPMGDPRLDTVPVPGL
jgi:hypothetical protein